MDPLTIAAIAGGLIKAATELFRTLGATPEELEELRVQIHEQSKVSDAAYDKALAEAKARTGG